MKLERKPSGGRSPQHQSSTIDSTNATNAFSWDPGRQLGNLSKGLLCSVLAHQQGFGEPDGKGSNKKYLGAALEAATSTSYPKLSE